jgi:hypothetical protein
LNTPPACASRINNGLINISKPIKTGFIAISGIHRLQGCDGSHVCLMTATDRGYKG